MSRSAVSPNGQALRHPGDLQWLERRRLQAADLFEQGKSKGEVAGYLGVSAQTAGRWWRRWRDGGVVGMRTARHGKPARLGPAELARIRQVLDRGPVAAGFDADLWTLARVAAVIERITGVAHLGAQGPHAGAAPSLPARQAAVDVWAAGLSTRRRWRGRAGGVDGV
jgi:transposase